MKERQNLSKKGRHKDNFRKPNKGVVNFSGEISSKQGGLKKNKNKIKNFKDFKKHSRMVDEDGKSKKTKTQAMPTKPSDPSNQQIILRKRVDPETAKYFTEISNLFESNEVDLEERSAICGNALEETRGKEVELATDMIISHTLQILLEGCELEQLCGFLQNCAKGFAYVAMDKFGSHVAETALKSLAKHLQDEGPISMIEDTLTKLCQMVVHDASRVMCCRYGSHVLRSLLCLCKGVPVDTLEEFHVRKPSAVLAGRLNFTPAQSSVQNTNSFQHGFTDAFTFLIREMLNHAKEEITTLRVNKYSTFVLQTALKLLVGDDQALSHAILIILFCEEKNMAQGDFIEAETKQGIVVLLEDTAFSHLFEVIIEVAPMTMYNALLNEVFKGSLFEISSLQCGSFVVQALVSSAKTKDQVNLIWDELSSKLEELLENGKSGVVASILASCQRLETHVHECCQALAAAVSSGHESTGCSVPHLLFLESYFKHKSSWTWPVGDKMHTLGCLILQTIFRCPKQFIRPYITSISSMYADHVFETAKDSGGSRVIETFLCSEASTKHKFELITKLQDHFGELAMHPSSSFTVEKCFTASNVSLKETIASELAVVQAELSKTKHGPYLLKKLDIDGFARQPEQWKRSRASKETIYKEFQAAFGSNNLLQEQSEPFQKPVKKQKREHEKKRKEPHHDLDVSHSVSLLGSEFPGLEATMAKMGLLGDKPGNKRERDFDKKKFIGNSTKTTPFVRNSGKRKSPASDLVDRAGRQTSSSGDVRKLFKSTSNAMKQSGKEKKPFLRKHRK